MTTAQEMARQLVGFLAPGEPLPVPLPDPMTTGKDVARGLLPAPGRSLGIPFPDPLGLLEAEAEGIRAPVVPVDILAGPCTRWFQGILRTREQAVRNYAEAIAQGPLNPRARVRAIDNYARALFFPRGGRP